MDIREFIEYIKDSVLIESGAKILNNAIADSHSDEYKIAVWWYGIKNGKFEISLKAKSHIDKEELPPIDRDNPDWVRGRVFESSENGKFYIIIYKDSFRADPLNGRILKLLYKKIQDAMPANITVAGVVDEEGRDLLNY